MMMMKPRHINRYIPTIPVPYCRQKEKFTRTFTCKGIKEEGKEKRWRGDKIHLIRESVQRISLHNICNQEEKYGHESRQEVKDQVVIRFVNGRRYGCNTVRQK